ncbi:hypothetical protein K8I61_02815 [bacterium]|nr:hypothetical protein [bacterium]
MASNTKQTESIRKRKHRHSGKIRKKKLDKDGTTPVFPVHPESKKATKQG